MSASVEHRKLAAIMFTDMVGYSALVERDEALALQLLEEHRRLLRSIFPKHDGFEIKTIGDGFLVEFSSALAAVQCGIEIQEAITRRNSANPSQGNFQLRIGIHAGDVVRRADDVIGDGVNIAARIVPLAGQGGICISQQVFDQVEHRLANSLMKMGQVKLKNISRPLEVYWVGYEGAAAEPPDLVQADNLGSAQKSIAVLPFVSMSSDPENEYLSDGLTEDLIMAFSRLKGLRVPARTSSFAFKGKNEDVRQIGQQLNVTKILEGSVRKAGERVRITAQLINAADGDHLWAQTFDRQLQDVFAIQDEITRAIVRELEMQLIGAGDQSVTQHGTYNTEAYQLYLQGRYHFYKFTGEGFRRCIECCKRALEIDPNYALAYAVSSLSYQTGWYYGFLSFEEKLAAIGPHDLFAEKAVELEPDLAETQTALGIVKCWNLRDWSGGEECFKRAIKLNPNYITAHEHCAALLACMRRTDEALTHARLALQIDPLSPMINLHMGLVYWVLHRYDLVLQQAERLFELESNFFGTYWLLGWAHWCQGKRDAAIADLRRAVTLGAGPLQLADLGCLLGRLDRKAEAQQVLEELKEIGKRTYVQPAYLGFVHASLGNYDEAFACFAQGMEHETLSVALIREYCISAGLDDLRTDPRFPALLKKIGLDETSRDDVASSGAAETVVKKQVDNSDIDTSVSQKKCRRCGAAIEDDQKTCINCLLHEGLETKGEPSRETFESVLVEANVTDTHWRLGHYEILEEIGRGGMGVIYRARQQHSRRIVAVKRVLAHQVNSHETLVRFRREAEAVASLDHPSILPIYEVSESEEGLPFFSMKFATGGSLRMAAPKLRESPRECVRVMAKVARAIAYAHGKGVLHRDLQPGNILLDENGEPMVSDFGLAKWLDQGSDLTRTLETLGTPGYIAPEQTDCPADKLTCAADVYSLGAILFYLLTGRPPFVGTNVLHVIHQAATTPAPRLRSLAPSLDRDLETIAARCLESDPKARYQSAGALAEDLEHWLRQEPIRARRVGIFTRGRKWVRRNPTSAALVASLIVLGAAVAVMFWDRGSLRQLPISTAVIPDKSIAVLPFENLSADPENAFFTDGVQDEILNDLAKIADLKVISRTSVMQYKSGVKRNVRQIANELGVAHVVEGSVQRVANRVRVSAQLIDAKSDTHSWANSYDRPLDDVFAIQADIAKAIAGQLQAKLSPAEKTAIEKPPTTNLIAYDRYLRAKKLLAQQTTQHPRDIYEMVRLLDQAVANDATFVLAYCELAQTHAYLYFLGIDHSPARIALAEKARDTALRLGPERGEPHLAAAWVAYWCYKDYETALAEVDIARHRLPNNAFVFEITAAITRRQGHWDESMKNFERAIELDPRNHLLLGSAGYTYEYERRFPEAAAYWDRAVALATDDPTVAVLRARIDFESRADTQPRYEAVKTTLAKDPSVVDRIADQWFDVALCRRDAAEMASALASLPPEGTYGVPRSFDEGLAARVGNDATGAEKAFTAARVELEKIVHEQPDYAQALSTLGMIDAALGHKEDALREGRRSVELLPVTKDAMTGADLLTNLAIIYAWVGEKDLAIKQLEEVLQVPGPACYGRLRLDPSWDPLRDDPRFEKLVEESKKPVALESPRPLQAGIAVLPFENLSADPENAFFTDGVQDEILNNLAKIADLKVISRTSVMQYKTGARRNLRQIANELGVAHVVEGSVQRAANRVRVSAQLIYAKSDTHMWAERYDRPLDDVFAIQSEIAKAIASQLQAKLSPSQSSALDAAPTRDTEAYDLFLKGEYQERQAESAENRELFDRAEAFYRQALARDPNFALAYARLAYSRMQQHWFIKRLNSAQLEEVKSNISRALAVAPDLPEAYLALGVYHYWGYLDYDSALRALDRAIELQPSNFDSRTFRAAIYRRRGEWRRSLAESEGALEVNPRDSFGYTDIGDTYLSLRRWSEAERALGRAVALDPHNINAGYHLAQTYVNSSGDVRRARQAWEGIPDNKTLFSSYGIVISQMISETAYLDVLERRFADALNVWDTVPTNTPDARLRQLDARIGIEMLAGQKAAAKSEAERARALLEARLAERVPGDRTSLTESAWVYVCLGRNADALRIAREAIEATPIEKDVLVGGYFLTGLAQIEAQIGHAEEAVKILRQLLAIPAGEYVSLTRLKIDPVWDPIRNNPEFQKLLSEPEPETVYK